VPLFDGSPLHCELRLMDFDILNPEALGEPRGWNNGLLAPAGGRVLFVAGQAGSDGSGVMVSDDFVDQFDAALARSLDVVVAAGGSAENVARLTIFVTDMDEYRKSLKPLGQRYRERMGRHFPAMALVAVAELVDPRAKVEIEATAVMAE
jgi:enamine deaminase RidA (YjgF/YER057c/UK114 family)